MNLDEGQKQQVKKWIEEGLTLAEVQERIAAEFGSKLTYMDVRLLVSDLNAQVKDKEPPKTELIDQTKGQTGPSESSQAGGASGQEGQPGGTPGQLSVTVDQITRPGAVVSGRVTFSDGMNAEWHLDQMGRLGLSPQQPGYKPSQEDVQSFQMELQNALAKMGF